MSKFFLFFSIIKMPELVQMHILKTYSYNKCNKKCTIKQFYWQKCMIHKTN